MKKAYIFWILSLFFSVGSNLNAQTTKEQHVKTIPFSILKTNNPGLELSSILNANYPFKPQKTYLKLRKPKDIYWIRLDFANNRDFLKKSEKWRLVTPSFGKAQLFYVENDSLKQKGFGKFDISEQRNSQLHSHKILFKKQNLIDDRYLYIKAHLITYHQDINTWKIDIISDEDNQLFNGNYFNSYAGQLAKDYLYLGACSIAFFLFLTIFIYSRRTEFLYYSLYVLCSIIYLIFPEIEHVDLIAFFDTFLGHWVIAISQVLINLFYVLFASHFLQSKKAYPKLHKIMCFVIYTLLTIVVLDATIYVLGYYTIHLKILGFQRLFMTIFGILSMGYLILKAKDKLALFIVLGSFLYMMGALLFLFLLNRYYMVTGSLLEIIVFSLGLVYKIKIDYEEKLELQNQVSIKEISALRAQMNPHFIFNSLNSIQHLILNNDTVSAVKYLSKFGRLTRNILESSFETRVTLTDEIKLLFSYLELESLRFNKTFVYNINTEEDCDTDSVEIPLLLIQPYVENAIIHGLMGKKYGKRILNINFKKYVDGVICEIEDNGIGRIASKNEKSMIKKQIKSRGMEITEKRLKLLGKYNTEKSSVEIVDRYDLNGNPTGTTVIIRIFEILKTAV